MNELQLDLLEYSLSMANRLRAWTQTGEDPPHHKTKTRRLRATLVSDPFMLVLSFCGAFVFDFACVCRVFKHFLDFLHVFLCL